MFYHMIKKEGSISIKERLREDVFFLDFEGCIEVFQAGGTVQDAGGQPVFISLQLIGSTLL